MMAALILVVSLLAIEAHLRTRSEAELYEDDMRRNQHVLGAALREAIELVWRSDGPAFAARVLEEAARGEEEIDVRLVKLSADAPLDERPRLSMPAEALRRLARGEEVVQLVHREEAGALYTYVPISLDGRGPSTLELSTSLRDEETILRRSMWRFSIVAAAITLGTAAFAMFLGNRMVGRPISTLVHHARRVGRGEFGHHPPLTQRDEIGDLGRELDAMADNLAQARARIETETRARIAATEKLRHAERLAAVGTLAAGIAHELGTPLHVIAGRAELALRSSPSSDLERHVTAIHDQSQRMQRIVRGLLAFARAEPGDRREHALSEILSRARELVDPLLTSHRVRFEIHDDTRASVYASSEQIEQVFTNLFINGVHAMPSGGVIGVTVERHVPPPELFDVPTDVPHMRIRVEDEGPGIGSEALDRILDPFFTTKDVGQGSGLGLSIAHGIVTEHGGALVAKNRESGGACFEVWLPEAK